MGRVRPTALPRMRVRGAGGHRLAVERVHLENTNVAASEISVVDAGDGSVLAHIDRGDRTLREPPRSVAPNLLALVRFGMTPRKEGRTLSAGCDSTSWKERLRMAAV